MSPTFVNPSHVFVFPKLLVVDCPNLESFCSYPEFDDFAEGSEEPPNPKKLDAIPLIDLVVSPKRESEEAAGAEEDNWFNCDSNLSKSEKSTFTCFPLLRWSSFINISMPPPKFTDLGSKSSCKLRVIGVGSKSPKPISITSIVLFMIRLHYLFLSCPRNVLFYWI